MYPDKHQQANCPYRSFPPLIGTIQRPVLELHNVRCVGAYAIPACASQRVSARSSVLMANFIDFEGRGMCVYAHSSIDISSAMSDFMVVVQIVWLMMRCRIDFLVYLVAVHQHE